MTAASALKTRNFRDSSCSFRQSRFWTATSLRGSASAFRMGAASCAYRYSPWRVVGGVVFGLLALSGYGQVSIHQRSRPASKQPAMPTPNLRVDTNLVLVPVTVDTQLNQPVTGLEKKNFRVYDDKVEQTITTLSTDDEPIAFSRGGF